MAQDYHIYIHGDGTQESQNKTKSWSSRKETSFPTKNGSNAVSKFSSVANTATNPDSLISTGMGALAKAIPAIAVAAIVISVIDKVASQVIDFQTIIGGDHSNQIAYSNFKTSIHNVFHPVSTAINVAKAKYRNINLDQTSKLTNQLHGDDYINSFNGYGV